MFPSLSASIDKARSGANPGIGILLPANANTKPVSAIELTIEHDVPGAHLVL
jgi:hypothetical protein